MPYISRRKFQIKTITSLEISQLSVTYGVIGDFTTGDGVKRPVCQRVFSGEKIQTPVLVEELFFSLESHLGKYAYSFGRSMK